MTAALDLDQHVALGFGEPGGINPITRATPNPVTDRWYDFLPEVYRQVDEDNGWALYAFMDACCSVLVEPTLIADRIAGGQFTDPALADDAWIPWVAQAVGIIGVGLAQQRARLATIAGDPAVGSRGYLEILTQTFLTDTKYVIVSAAPPWGIEVRIRAEELSLVGGTVDGLRAALYATGRIPAGYVLTVLIDVQTWAQLAVAMQGTWAPGEGKTWKVIDTWGMATAGFASGAVGWAGTETGHM